jgi:hypothetical protein
MVMLSFTNPSIALSVVMLSFTHPSIALSVVMLSYNHGQCNRRVSE